MLALVCLFLIVCWFAPLYLGIAFLMGYPVTGQQWLASFGVMVLSLVFALIIGSGLSGEDT